VTYRFFILNPTLLLVPAVRPSRRLGRLAVLHLDEHLQPVRRLGVLVAADRFSRTRQRCSCRRRWRHDRRDVYATITTALVGVRPAQPDAGLGVILSWPRASHVLDSAEAGMRTVEANEKPSLSRPRCGPGTAAVAAKLSGDASRDVIGGGMLDGITHHVVAIPAGIVTHPVLHDLVDVPVLPAADIVKRVFGDDSCTDTVFGAMDIAVNALTLLSQLFLTGRFIKWLGIGAAGLLPLVTMVGFGIMGFAPTIAVLVVFQTIRRAGNFAIQRPGREALFTVLDRSDKYKAKNFVDTTVYRFGDQVGAWSYTWMGIFGLGLSGLAFTMVPLSAAWLVLTLWLGKKYRPAGRRSGTGRPDEPRYRTTLPGGVTRVSSAPSRTR
jgi:AAA family ATP:ADP antiporter